MVEPVKLEKCGHVFCVHCLNMAWAKQEGHDKKCPICRASHKFPGRFGMEDLDLKK